MCTPTLPVNPHLVVSVDLELAPAVHLVRHARAEGGGAARSQLCIKGREGAGSEQVCRCALRHSAAAPPRPSSRERCRPPPAVYYGQEGE